MVTFEPHKLRIEIDLGKSSTPDDVAAEWKDLHNALLFLCANVKPPFEDSEEIKMALTFLEELMPANETAKKMVTE